MTARQRKRKRRTKNRKETQALTKAMLLKAVDSLKAAKVAPKESPTFIVHPNMVIDWWGLDLPLEPLDIFGLFPSEEDRQPHFECCDDADRLHDLKLAAKKWSEKYAALRAHDKTEGQKHKSGKGSSYYKTDPAYNNGATS